MICDNFDRVLQDLTSRYEQVCVVGDAKVKGEKLKVKGGWPALWLEVSEDKKSLKTVQAIWDFLFAQSMTRRGVLVCIGGGVLADLAGFAAATYKRGIDYINIPTTLLAMVDASTGGKTGINYSELKNSIGVFAPPVETIIWPGWLTSLPAKEFLNGYAEMLKTGLIVESGKLWDKLLQYDLERMEIVPLKPLISDCVEVKEQIVQQDPREDGLRKVLNLGHTFGHALEQISIQHAEVSHPMPHGYAVLYGLIAELYLSVTKLGCPKEPLQQLTQLMLHYYGRPVCNCKDREELIRLMQQDKKNERAAEINCTLIRDIGQPVINQILSIDEANEALEYLFSL